jgi:outer membrane protein TolC
MKPARLILTTTIFICICFTVSLYSAVLEISLTESEKNAEENSARLQSSINEQKAIEQKSLEQQTQLFPKLTLDGNYRYNTMVPEIGLKLPGIPSMKFGDNTNYSIGPSLLWTAWDAGATRNTYESSSLLAQAKKSETETIKKQLNLSVRLLYFQVSLAGEQILLINNSLKLANDQYEDIEINVRAGTKSLVDKLSAHQEVLARLKQLRQARADMAAALRDLCAATGKTYKEDFTSPIDSRVNELLSKGVSEPTAVIKLESIDSLLERFLPCRKLAINEKHPSLETFRYNAESARLLADGAASGRWPKLQVMAKSSIDYPFGTTLESYNQNTFGVNLSMPLFESGLTTKKISENKNTSLANIERREQMKNDYFRDWNKALDQLANLDEQLKLNEVSVSETEQLSEIIFKSYKSGAVTYLEVQNANFKALEAKIQHAKLKVQMLMNLAVLANLGE